MTALQNLEFRSQCNPFPSNTRVLLFIDHPIVLTCLRYWLADTSCDAVSTEEEAVQKIQQTDYDLIFMTLQWSVECSVQRIRAIRAQYADPFDPPLIALTTDNEPAVRNDFFRAGARLVIRASLNASILQRLSECFLTPLPNLPQTVFDYAASIYQMGYSMEQSERLIHVLYTELNITLSEIVAAEQSQDLTRYRDQLIHTLETVSCVRLPELEELVEQALLALGQSFDITYIWNACIEIQKALQRILNQLLEIKSKLFSLRA